MVAAIESADSEAATGMRWASKAQLKTSPIIHGLIRRRALNRTAGLLALKI
jgi:hypothetical protein